MTASPPESHGLPPARTSQTHPMEIDLVAAGVRGGAVGLTFCPGRRQSFGLGGPVARDLAADIRMIREAGAHVLLTLMETIELATYQITPSAIERHAREAGLLWHHLPIADAGVPNPGWERLWRRVGPRVRRVVEEGGTIVAHCRGGFGRAGLVAARLLVELGEPPESAIARVRAARPGAIETRGQEAYVRALGKTGA